MQDFTEHLESTQREQARADQIQNRAGGYVYPVTDWTRLDRFLVLGTEGGTYYATERDLTRENVDAVLRCIDADATKVVNRVVTISEAGRAPKNDAALFVLALVAKRAAPQGRRAAYDALARVARIGTHLFTFVHYAQQLGGWGRGMRRAVGDWYTAKTPEQLAYQVTKYRQRNGWSHRDCLRLAHPHPTPDRQGVFSWIVKPDEPTDAATLQPFLALQRAETAKDVIRLVTDHSSLSWEMIPTQFLGDPKVWAALLPKLPLTALIRNLGRMTANGLLTPLSVAAGVVCERLANEAAIRKARVHPLHVLTAMLTYRAGRGQRGSLAWQPVGPILDALDGAFYTAFGNVRPTGQRIVIALDCSASMGWGTLAGVQGLCPRVAAAALSLVTVATEPRTVVTGFGTTLTELPITAKQRLDDVAATMQSINFGGTDCALPMVWALSRKIEADAFVVFTDNETWAGNVHPDAALRTYRQKTGIPAKLVVVGMTATECSIADPTDGGMLDVCGWDSATPNLISDFLAPESATAVEDDE